MDLIKNDNDYMVSARQLHKELGIRRNFPHWIKDNLERALLEHGKDFLSFTTKSNGGRPSIDYLLKKDSALTIIVISGGINAKAMRDEVIKLYNMYDTGLAFTAPQIEALIDLSKAMTLISIQKEVERKHFDLFNNRYEWVKYRARML